MALRSGRFAKNARLVQVSNNNPAMRQGEKGDAVAIVQQSLVDLGFDMPITTKNGLSLADGIFGQETLRIVKLFQTQNGLTADGIVGRNTMAMLDDLIVAQSTAKSGSQNLQSRNQFAVTTAKV
ncbi:MAG: peptidoglycan-binding protein [Planctomycetia bacterium]|nr:peptidoglycan-binding protein [Planctomycetia bacterium]